MKEIATNVFIETQYPGVTLGAINKEHGLILIDAPLRYDDARLWKTAILTMKGGVERTLVNLDAHYDRTLGARLMDCNVIGHEQLALIIRARPLTFKAQGDETGAEWELLSNLGNIRWGMPEITFSDRMEIHWDENPLILEHHMGSSQACIWALLPQDGVAFVGDTIVSGQPPFLAGANIPTWLESCKVLLSTDYQSYTIISGRGGIVKSEDVRKMVHFLEKAQKQMEKLAGRGGSPHDTGKLALSLINDFEFSASQREHYLRRLQYGLFHYYLRHYRTGQNPTIAD
jgi:glyoxylase-like metal-dependent hydrolase (beta-lactamase superfamily II)